MRVLELTPLDVALDLAETRTLIRRDDTLNSSPEALAARRRGRARQAAEVRARKAAQR